MRRMNGYYKKPLGLLLLREASCRGYLDIVQLLLDHCGDRETVNNNGSTALHVEACDEQPAAAAESRMAQFLMRRITSAGHHYTTQHEHVMPVGGPTSYGWSYWSAVQTSKQEIIVTALRCIFQPPMGSSWLYRY
jgi:hypothetical protein